MLTDRAIVASGHCPALLLRPSDAGAIATLGSTVNNGAAFSLAGTRVATVDVDGVLAVWNSADGKLLLSQSFNDPARAVSWLGESELLIKTRSLHMIRLALEVPS